MPNINIDHVVIAAISLEQGADYIKSQLGVDIPFGGVHPSMGTHNLLMQLGDSVFLEVIAVNPQGELPVQPRWYGLDDPYVRAQIVDEPALVGWVVNTDSIERVLSASWKFGLPDDGRLLAAGMLPYIIEWECSPHPAALMADTGCQLVSLAIEHPHSTWLQKSLDCIGATKLLSIVPADRPRLSVSIDTPKGIVTLQSSV